MKLNNIELYDFFQEQKITHLYHANTTTTSISFIKAGGLLSRGDVVKNGLIQTEQSSDSIDQSFDVWSDIFLDTTDLHKLFSRQNRYGPILFVFEIEFLLNSEIEVWITKNNPIYWCSSFSDTDKYFQSVSELREKWSSIERQRKMVTLRKPSKPILFSYLSEILIDNPSVAINNDIDLHLKMTQALFEATERLEWLREKINIRNCSRCFCKNNYLNEVSDDELKKLFLPSV